MKVLFTFGGIPHYLDALLNLLQKRGTEITVVTPKTGNSIIGKGVKMVEGGTYRRIFSPEQKMRYGKAGYPQLSEILQEIRPDIVVLGWPYLLQVAFDRKLRHTLKQLNIKLLLREIPFQTPPANGIRQYFRKNPMYNEQMKLKSRGAAFFIRQWLTAQIRKRCYRLADGTLNYATVAYDILPSYGVNPEKIHVTLNATDTEALLKEREQVEAGQQILPENQHRILHIGRLVRWKRVDLLIDAMPAVLNRFPDAELVIVGDGPEQESLRQQARQLKIEDHVRFAGAIYKPEELGAYMHESTVYVLAGMGGLSINDAMTYGLPIICSVCDGTEKDLVYENKNGFYFREGDADSLSNCICRLFASPEKASAMGKASEQIIHDKANLNSVCDNYLKAFRETLEHPESV